MVGARPRRIRSTDSASSSAFAPCMPSTTSSMAMNTLPMIFSCSDRKPIDHLGIKIPRIGLPLLGSVSQMNAEESGSRIRKMGCRLPVPVPRPCLIIRAAGT
jgi:hypothetical protein